ncbi:C40 family peptidase [Streptomyces sp. AV19]|uniref:C40 family peptidase n=1 Tax=Streptomyces sp. AV19 TaxID=2793068 RepID=UPI0018FE5C11|nr:NlpC/P60 family protein [Streptomyces sp. AV19]MBH1934140.1 C40 family peptidase [Streptomyces sp. AV19]MDG4537138.1 NlpC/P60 family protein [Streptomyces sp. AV19]
MSAASSAAKAAGAAVIGIAFLGIAFLAVIGAAVQDDERPGISQVGLSGGKLNEKNVPREYLPWVLKAGAMCPEAPPPIIAAQIEAESNWDPTVTSPVGAMGISQFMPGTWRDWGVDADGDGKKDAYTAADGIMSQGRYDCHVAEKVKSYGITGVDPVRMMLGGYNAGPEAVRLARGIPRNSETQGYVRDIMKLAATKYTAPGSTTTGGPLPAGGDFGQKVISQASLGLGIPYAWGGGTVNGPSRGFAQGAGTVGFDCSSFVQWAVYQASKGKITVPRTTEDQARAGQEIKPEDMRSGDVVVFSLHGGGYDHVGIYVGGTTMIHAPKTGDVVKFADMSDPYYGSKSRTIRRYW